MNKTIIVSAIAVIVVGAGAFFGGLKYQQSKTATRFANFGNRMQENSNNSDNAGMRQRIGQNFRPVNGEITATDDKSITVKMADGSSRIVLLSETTALLKSSSGSKEDLKEGEQVMVIGTENSDGSVTAQNIQINPVVRRLGNEEN